MPTNDNPLWAKVIGAILIGLAFLIVAVVLVGVLKLALEFAFG